TFPAPVSRSKPSGPSRMRFSPEETRRLPPSDTAPTVPVCIRAIPRKPEKPRAGSPSFGRLLPSLCYVGMLHRRLAHERHAPVGLFHRDRIHAGLLLADNHFRERFFHPFEQHAFQ